MSRRLFTTDLQPAQFVGRMLFLIKWLLAPRRADDVVHMVPRWATQKEIALQQRTDVCSDAVQLADTSFIAEAVFHDARLDYARLLIALQSRNQPTRHEGIEDWEPEFIIFGSDVVWDRLWWLAELLHERCQRDQLVSLNLDPASVQSFERRLAKYLRKTYISWYEATPVPVSLPSLPCVEDMAGMPPSLIRVKQSFENMFGSVEQWNATPYHTWHLLKQFHRFVHSYHAVYSSVPLAYLEKLHKLAINNRLSFPRIAQHSTRYNRSDCINRITVRLAYLVAFIGAIWASGLDSTRYVTDRLAESLSRAHEMTGLLASLIKEHHFHMTTLEDEERLQESRRRKLSLFWEWYTEEVLLPLQGMLTISALDRSLMELIDKEVSTLLLRYPLRAPRKVAYQNSASDRDSTTQMTASVLPWMTDFANSPLEPFTLLQKLMGLEEQIWSILEDTLLSTIDRSTYGGGL